MQGFLKQLSDIWFPLKYDLWAYLGPFVQKKIRLQYLKLPVLPSGVNMVNYDISYRAPLDTSR